MELDFYHVAAFSDKAFAGNPAAVFILKTWLSDELMQAIAAEFNLSETVFSVWEGEHYRIRWFTPTTEVALCGHATVATSHVLHQHLDYGQKSGQKSIRFMSLSGALTTHYERGLHTLDFPANPPTPCDAPANLQEILGCNFLETHAAGKKLVVQLTSEEQVKALRPDFFNIAKLPFNGVCVTAFANQAHNPDLDFVCRYFAPVMGINEDPVTGSAYTVLGPYYAAKTGKTAFRARQLSLRGGLVGLQVPGERVLISGKAHTVMQGRFFLDSL